MFLGALVPNKQVGVSVAPLTIIPFMLFSGFFVNQDSIPPIMLPLQYISMFKYGLQALMANEYDQNLLKKLDCYPQCNPL